MKCEREFACFCHLNMQMIVLQISQSYVQVLCRGVVTKPWSLTEKLCVALFISLHLVCER